MAGRWRGADHVRRNTPRIAQKPVFLINVPFFLIFSSFAIILPPVGVFLERGCNADFLINILLVSLFLLLNNRANAHQHFSTDHPGLHVCHIP